MTAFHTLDRKVVVQAPPRLLRQLVELCDGTRRHEDVVEALKDEWDKESLLGLIGDLIQKSVLVDARALGQEIWRAVENPMRFPMSVSEEQVFDLVKDASERVMSPWDVCGERASEEGEFLSVIDGRHSSRFFSGDAVPLQSVIDILWATYGNLGSELLDVAHKTVPSAGALCPLMVHVVFFRAAENTNPGVYRVQYGNNRRVGLELLSEDVNRVARSFLSPLETLNGVYGVVIISGSLTVTGRKYGNRSMLYVPLEAGHAVQNCLLQAKVSGVATREVGGFVDQLLLEALDLPPGYQPMTTVLFGLEGLPPTRLSIGSTLEVDWAVPMAEGYRPPFALASARVSAERSWSHGRDASPEIALIKAIAEGREWAACGSIPELVSARYIDLESVVHPKEIVAFHPAQYRVKDFPFAPFDDETTYAWTEGAGYANGSAVKILADHVYFPYFPETQWYAFANSSGCAAHPDEETAIRTGTLELVERDAFMNVYLGRLALPTVLEWTLPEHIRDRMRLLEKVGFKVWIKDHSLEFAPVATVVAQSDELTFTTCASCSSFDIEHAVSHALMEVEASVLARLQNGQPGEMKPDWVGVPLDHGQLYAQPRYYRHADFLVEGGGEVVFAKMGNNAARSWEELLDRFAGGRMRLITIPMQLSEEYGGNDGLHIVRAVVPGLVPMTFGYRQEPAGMERVYQVAERVGGRKLSYGELTKFPHPFE